MNAPQFNYTEKEWKACAAHHPLRGLDLPQLMLLHRHWIWANHQQVLLDAELRAGRPPRPNALAEDSVSAMFLWYALLWAVIEGFNEREIQLLGRLAEDVERISDGLRRCRNAVFHIPRDEYYDQRLFEFMREPDSAATLRRISSGFGRLFIEEFDHRGIDGTE